MHTTVRISLFCAFALFALTQTACSVVPHQALRQSQLRSRQLYTELGRTNGMVQSLTAEKQQLESQLSIANRRLDNLNAERSKLQQRYIGLMNRARNGHSPLSDDLTRRFEKLAEQYPEFDFDPNTGVSKFHSDILFASGVAEIKPSALPILREFANIMNDGDANRLNILVVGHTDDRRIVKRSTKSKHASNWHLSTNRANAVVLALKKFGVKQSRMGSAGYSMFQPVVANSDDKARARNRRVEIFVLAPDAVVAGWDSDTSRN